MKVSTLLFSMTIVGLLSSCGNSTSDDVMERATHDTVRWETYETHRHVGPCEDTTFVTECVRIAVALPGITDDRAVGKAIAGWMDEALYADPESGAPLSSLDVLADTITRRYPAHASAGPTPRQAWSLERTATMVVNDSTTPFVTVTVLRFDYLGGAHPATTVAAQSFRVDDGRRLALDDVLTGDYRQLLDTLAETAFRVTRGVPDSASLPEAGFFQDGVFRRARTWMLSAAGIEFYYNTYEAASYAQGPTAITVPWSALDGYRAPFIDRWWRNRSRWELTQH